MAYGCSGCHGGGGGGGMCPPLINDVWVYGGDDDTLFRLVTLGSIALQQRGYMRIGQENVVGPMPPFGGIIKNADDLWKIFAFVRSRNDGDHRKKLGGPPGQLPKAPGATCHVALQIAWRVEREQAARKDTRGECALRPLMQRL